MNTRSCSLALLAGLSTLVALNGCVSYANWPPVPDNVAVNDPNSPATAEVMTAGLRWAINKYPPEGESATYEPPAPRKAGDPPITPRAAVNIPVGIKSGVYQRIAQDVGPGVVPLTPDSQKLPTYHIGWVRIRGDEAYVTVFRPVLAIGGTSTTSPLYQEIRLGLRGGLQPWTVNSIRPWEVGSKGPPEANYYVPEPAAPAPKPSPFGRDAETTYKPGPRAIEAPKPDAKTENAPK
jgi:hypothetical protein